MVRRQDARLALVPNILGEGFAIGRGNKGSSGRLASVHSLPTCYLAVLRAACRSLVFSRFQG
jgi:hypothetical protein